MLLDLKKQKQSQSNLKLIAHLSYDTYSYEYVVGSGTGRRRPFLVLVPGQALTGFHITTVLTAYTTRTGRVRFELLTDNGEVRLVRCKTCGGKFGEMMNKLYNKSCDCSVYSYITS